MVEILLFVFLYYDKEERMRNKVKPYVSLNYTLSGGSSQGSGHKTCSTYF